MSEFSLDDILDKYGHKDGGGSPGGDADDILSDILGEEAAPRGRPHNTGQKQDPFVNVFGQDSPAAPDIDKKKQETEEKRKLELEEKRKEAEKRRAEFEEKQRAAEEKKREELARKQQIAEERKRSELEVKRVIEEKKREELEAKRRAEEEKKRKAEEEKQKKAERERRQLERNALIQGVMDEKERRAKRAADEGKRREQEEAERKRAAEEEAAAKAAEEERARAEALENERKRLADDEAERRYATKSIVLQDAPIEIPTDSGETAEETSAPTTEELQLEKTLRAQKIQIDSQKLLIKETALEDPDDFLSSINPYEFGKKSDYTQQIETISAAGLSGDTKGVDAEELREMARTKHADGDDTRSIERIVDGATRVMPDIEHSGGEPAIDPDGTFELSDDIKEFIPRTRDTKEVRRSEDEERVMRSVNDTLEQKRISDKRDTNPVSVYDTGPFDKIVIPTRTMKYESEGNKVLRTGEIPKSDPEVAEQKLKELAAKRKRRLSNFVLEDIADEDVDYYDDSEPEEAAIDDAGIWTDLVETQKSLRLRFVLLLIVALGLAAVNLLQRLFIYQKIGAFGNEIGILDTKGLVFANMICGVIGMVLCSSVITSGLGKLFRARADCDSVCALSCVLSIAASVLHLVDTNDLQQGRAYIYIPVALIGLVFNSFGKLSMISRARKNYRFTQSDAARYYAEVVDGQSEASALTKGSLSELPYLVTMRKTELFTDFLKKSYCEDMADRVSRRLVPISLAVGLIMGLLVYFIPNGTEVNGVKVYDNNIYWATSVFVAFVTAMAPFSMMFMVNNPFRRASRQLLKHGSALLGYTSAEEFGETNSVIVDASTLFPKSAVECTNIKPCKLQNSLNSISLDQAIILAASLAVNSDSVLSSLLFDMIGGNKDMLVKIDGCVYEDNMGVMGWYENKRLILGSRDQMKHHSVKIPELSAIAKYSRNGSDSVYLAVGGELAVIFFIRLTANPAVRAEIKELTSRGVSVVLKTTDSLITTGKVTDLFDIDPERLKIIGASLHGLYSEVTSYTASGCGALACTGSFVSLAKGINASKKLLKDINMSRTVMLLGVVLGALFMIFLAFTQYTFVFSPEIITGWNLIWLVIMLFLQCFRKY